MLLILITTTICANWTHLVVNKYKISAGQEPKIKYQQYDESYISISKGDVAFAHFLGSLGIITNSFLNTAPIAYMVPAFYYMVSFSGGKKYLSSFYLFSMTEGSYTEKWYLFFEGCVYLSWAALPGKARGAFGGKRYQEIAE